MTQDTHNTHTPALGPRRAAFERMVTMAKPAADRIERAIPGLGAVRLDVINGKRFVHVDGRIESLKQLRADCDAADAGLPTSHDRAVSDLAAALRASEAVS